MSRVLYSKVLYVHPAQRAQIDLGINAVLSVLTETHHRQEVGRRIPRFFRRLRRPNGSLNRAGDGLVVCGRGPDGGGGKVTLGELEAVLLAMNHLSHVRCRPRGKKIFVII